MGQLDLFLGICCLHPNGQVPAYEWNFDDVNPPVHTWATLFVYHIDEEINGRPDTDFLTRSFQKLLANFTGWLNRKDRGRDLILFHEYFHGDNGTGLGASHQMGWTGLIARLLQMVGSINADDALSESWPELFTYDEAR